MDPDRIWYGGPSARSIALLPLSWLYCAVARLRRLGYRRGWLASAHPGVPVIVVGNLSVGGAGKTPLVLWLVAELRRRGHRPGIASRGYGGRGDDAPRDVPLDGDPAAFGDEPLLLARRAGVPVVVGRDRVAAARRLAAHHGCDRVVTDDGLQHYRLARDLEIAVIDGERGLGNRRCLPAGPLREPSSRLASVDLVVQNGGPSRGQPRFVLRPGDACSLVDSARKRSLDALRGERITAVAGIGNPRRFFGMLRELGLAIEPRAYPDHHAYTAADVASWGAGTVLMTEKDAVKCAAFAAASHWYLPVTTEPEPELVAALDGRLADLG